MLIINVQRYLQMFLFLAKAYKITTSKIKKEHFVANSPFFRNFFDNFLRNVFRFENFVTFHTSFFFRLMGGGGEGGVVVFCHFSIVSTKFYKFLTTLHHV